jgi:hypothetical protein
VDVLQGAIPQQMQKETLGKVLCVGWLVSATTSESVERIPIEPTELTQRCLAPWHLALGSNKNLTPARRAKARWISRHRRMLRIHVKTLGLLPRLAANCAVGWRDSQTTITNPFGLPGQRKEIQETLKLPDTQSRCKGSNAAMHSKT